MKSKLEFSETNKLDKLVKSQIFDLWNSEYPDKLSFQGMSEFENYLKNLKILRHFMLKNKTNLLVAWGMTFERDSEKWFAIIVTTKMKGKGLGRKILDEIKNTETTLNGWVIDHNGDRKTNGQEYISPLKFYEKCGFRIIENERLEHDKISAVKIKWTTNQ